MAPQEGKPTVVNAFPMLCEGAGGKAPLRRDPAHASVTIFSDGSREVGCGFLNREFGLCRAPGSKEAVCVQLFPVSQSNLESVIGRPLPIVARDSHTYIGFGTTTDDRRVGVWEDPEGGRHAEYVPDDYHAPISRRPREDFGLIGPNDQLWTELHPRTESPKK